MSDPLFIGTEPFTLDGSSIGFTLQDFWGFQFSNIWDMQDQIAEFIVARALGLTMPYNKNGWTLWDIAYQGKRVEVKTTAYYHSWRADGDVSKVRSFSIEKAYTRYKDRTSEYKRQNDIYVFCLNTGTTRESSNPMRLENWRFFVIPTATIDRLCGNNKHISLGRVKRISGHPEGLSYTDLKQTVDRLLNL